MKNNDGIHKYSPLWGEWEVEQLIGIGSYGKVYKISKQLGDDKIISAVKHITIPTTSQYEDAMLSLGNNQDKMNSYFKDIVNKFENEIKLLYILRGNTNIVNYEDYMIKEREDFGWDIFIKMEYVIPLNKLIEVKDFTREMIINLGIDICNGLKLCHDNGIIHRDIKDSNIFISSSNNFKIGDFGVATNLASEEAMTRIGTPYYMAPEMILNYNNEGYDKTVDIYSLGIVLYRLFNRLKFPFVPLDESQITFNTKEMAQAKRVSGEELLRPCNADDKVWSIIKKACAHNPKDRYAKVEDLKLDLYDVLRGMDEHEKNEVIIKATGISMNNPYFTYEDKADKDSEEKIIEHSEANDLEMEDNTVLLDVNNEDTILLENDDTEVLRNNIHKTKNKNKFNILINTIILTLMLGGGYLTFILNGGYYLYNYLNYEPKLIPIEEKKGKWGYVDVNKDNKVVIESKFEWAEEFSEGLAAVKINEEWGYINEKGKIVIEPQFDSAYNFSEGLAVVSINGEDGYIDKKGEIVIEPQFYDAGVFNEGLASVWIDGGYGYIDKKGKIVIDPQFDEGYEFNEGLAAVQIHGKWGYIDKKGEFVIEPKFEWAYGFSEGLAAVEIDKEWGYINKTGKIAIEPKFDYTCEFNEGLANVQIDGKCGYIDKKGEIVIEPKFDDVGGFSEGLAPVWIGESYGYIDKTGNIIIESKY